MTRKVYAVSVVQWGMRNKLLIAIISLLLLPVVLTSFMFFQINRVEQFLIKHQRTRLARMVDDLDQELTDSFAQGQFLSGDKETPQSQQVEALDAVLKNFVAAHARDFPELEVGFYSRELNTMLVKGTGSYYLGRTFPTIQEQLLQQAEEGKISGQRSGTVIEIYKPFVLHGRVHGIVWGTENLNLSGIQARVEETKAQAYALIGISLFLGLGGSLYLIRNFIAGAQQVTSGLRKLEYDLNYVIPPTSGEFGQIIAAINHLSTQLIKAQNFNQIALASINDGVVAVDTDGRVMTINPAALRILELPPDSPGKYLAEVFPPGAPFVDMLREALRGERLCREERVAWTSPQQETKQLLVSTAQLVNGRGQVVGAVLNCLDITEGVKLQEQMHRQERLASLGKLVAGVAHEIRNPLTSISGYIEYLEKSKNPSPRSWANIQREIKRLNMIVEKLLFFARPAQSKFIPADLNSLVENALQFFAETGGGSVEIRKELVLDLPPAKIDAEQMEQALKNIIFNAFQAMPGGGTLTVRTGQTAEGMLYIDVHDTGCGIAEEDLPRVFDPFFTTRTKGTGLGLTIAYEILQAHGGGIEVTSRPGEGSVFRLFVQPAGGDLA